MRRTASAVAGGVVVVGLAGCSPALDWREARPEGSGLSLLMPCRPDGHARNVSLAGQTVRLELSACSAGGATWAVAHADVADPARVGPALQALLDGARANAGGGDAGRPASLSVPGATPNPVSARLSFSGRKPDGAALASEVAVFSRGTRVFQATALGAAVPPEGAETFFGSLRLDAGVR